MSLAPHMRPRGPVADEVATDLSPSAHARTVRHLGSSQHGWPVSPLKGHLFVLVVVAAEVASAGDVPRPQGCQPTSRVARPPEA
jgi:hypothetical protein